MDKMREAFERDHGKLSDDADMRNVWERNKHMMLWAWQAAQSAAVPVVGEVVAYACPFHASQQFVNGIPCMLVEAVSVNSYGKERGYPLIIQPTHSISADELYALRRDAERLDAAMKIMFDDWHPLSVAFAKMQTASTRDELFEQLDAAIAGEKKDKENA